jgi:hypothetical protein
MRSAETHACPVCHWPAGVDRRCTTCQWQLSSDYQLGAVTPDDERAFTVRLHDAQRRLDTAAALRVAGYPGDADPLLLGRLETLVRSGPLPAAERDRLVRPAVRDEDDGDGFPLAPGTVVVEVGADGIASSAWADTAGDGRRESAELSVWPWSVLLPGLPDDPAERLFRLAGGVGPAEPDRAAEMNRLSAVLPDHLPTGGAPIALVCLSPGWAWPEYALDLLARRHPHAALLRPAGTGGTRAGSAMIRCPGGLTAFAAGPGMSVATGDSDGSVTLWDPVTGGPVRRSRPHVGRVTALATAPDGSVVSGGQDGSVRFWSTVDDRPAPVVAWHASWVNAVGVTMEAVYSLGDDGLLRRTPRGSGLESAAYPVEVGFSAAAVLAVSADDALIAYGGANGAIVVLVAGTAERVEEWRLPVAVTALAFDPAGRLLAAGGADGATRIYSITGRAQRSELDGHDGPARGIALDARGTAIVGDDQGTVRRWQLRSGRPTGAGAELGAHRDAVRGVAVIPDGRPVSAGADGLIRLWSGSSVYRTHTRDKETR